MSHIEKFDSHEQVAVGRGPVGLEPIFRALDERLVSEAELQQCYDDYKKSGGTSSDTLVKNLVRTTAKAAMKADPPDWFVDDCSKMCIEKLAKQYDPSKGKAFNFLTTLTLAWLRQHRLLGPVKVKSES